MQQVRGVRMERGVTFAELIRELQAMPPHLAVRVVLESVWICDEGGELEIDLDETDATEADRVRHCGPYVLIEGR